MGIVVDMDQKRQAIGERWEWENPKADEIRPQLLSIWWIMEHECREIFLLKPARVGSDIQKDSSQGALPDKTEYVTF